ncbi:VOC family protein [Bordetella sp. 2513F-2]
MSDPDFIILYVDAPQTSAAFYAGLLGRDPVENTPDFALFILDSGLRLGLWARHDVAPLLKSRGSGVEIVFPVADMQAVEALHAHWTRRGLAIAQPPTTLAFGHTFVALDPDGHRLRVYARQPRHPGPEAGARQTGVRQAAAAASTAMATSSAPSATWSPTP